MSDAKKKKGEGGYSGELSDKMDIFCLEYIASDLNGSQAAMRAGYSAANSRQQAARLLSKANIQARIAELKAQRVERLGVSANYVLQRLLDIDTLDVMDILDDSGNLKQIKEWPKAWRVSISGLDVSEMVNGDIASVVKKIKWPDKLRNLELIGKHIDVKAWDKEETKIVTTHNIMPVPTSDSVDDWEATASSQQDEILSDDR